MHNSSRRSAGAVLALLFLFVAGWAPRAEAQPAEGLTPLQVAQIQSVSNAVMSPDGRHVVFTRIVPADPREANDPAASHLFAYDVQNDRELALYDGRVSGVQFRPEHGTVSFLSRGEGDNGNALYQMAITGGEPQRLFAHGTSIRSYGWAPDGERISFVADEALDLPESELPYQPEFFEENVPNRRAYVASLSSQDVRPINIPGSFYNLSWSPNGDRIAASVAPTPTVDDSYMAQRVYVVDASSGDVVAEVQNHGKLGQIEWSPDGSRLALRAGNDINDPTDGRILVVSAEGGQPENILPDFEGKFEQIAWTDDGLIHFVASEGTERSFGTVTPGGRDLTRVIEPGKLVVTAFAAPQSGRVALIANTPRHPAELFVMNVGSREPQRLTNSNPWLDDVPFGRQEAITYTTRDNAYEIEGILIYPTDYRDGQRLPLITVVHGGPESHYSNGWLTTYSMPGQVGAANGYAVFYPNYRGSTGRGLSFAMSSQGDLAGAEFDDIVDGVDHLISAGLVDESRVGVTGGSYGGYATAWMSTRYSDRFAAGVMSVGISNNISKWGTSDIPEELYHVHSRKRIWDHWQWNLERSPIYWVENAQTPLLIMHGKEDTRVHPAQSLELYRHLKVRKPDVPVRLVLYPGEGHGNARATSRYDFSLRMMQWFDTYLKGEGREMPLTHSAAEPAESVGG